MKHLAREVIESHAFSSGHFRRGEGCAKLIRNVKSTMVEDGIQFIGQCEYVLHLCFTETALPNSCFAEQITWVALRTMSALHPTKDSGLNFRKFPSDWEINSSFIECY